MRLRRRLPIWLGVLLVIAAVSIIVVLRKHAPPEPARLLPGADGFFYVNLKWVRRTNVTGQLPGVSHDPDYEKFVEQTGFDFERDLNQAAFAIHYPASLPMEARADGPRFSEVFVGKIDGQRLRDYLKGVATSVEPYRSIDIYNIPLEGRTVRVAILNWDTVAASNHPDPQVIRGMVDRSKKLASPFGGPQLLRQYYKHVPLASLAWAVIKVSPDSGTTTPGPIDISFLFNNPAVVVTSARWLGSLHLRAAAYTDNPDQAQHVADQLNTFLAMFHAAESNVTGQGPDMDVKGFFNSLKVEQDNKVTALTAILPPGFMKKMFEEPPKDMMASPDAASSKPQSAPAKKH
ncbi:MAG TPA: hypothetical protein VGF44_01195 [Terriglobales bacterium]|jgi:hypothetical protein